MWGNAIRKYGIDAMRWVILERCACEADAYFLEIMHKAQADGNGEELYNAKDGGLGVSSPEMKDRWADPAFRAKAEAGMANPELRAALKKAMKTRWADPKQRATLTEAIRAAVTTEQRAKRSAAMRTRRADPDQRAKHSAAMKPFGPIQRFVSRCL